MGAPVGGGGDGGLEGGEEVAHAAAPAVRPGGACQTRPVSTRGRRAGGRATGGPGGTGAGAEGGGGAVDAVGDAGLALVEGVLEGDGGEPLLGEAALEEGDGAGDEGEPVHPRRQLRPAERPREEGREVVAVLADEVVLVPLEVPPQRLDQVPRVRRREVRVAQQDGLPSPIQPALHKGSKAARRGGLEFEVLAEVLRVPWVVLEDAGEGEGVAPVRVLCTSPFSRSIPTQRGEGGEPTP